MDFPGAALYREGAGYSRGASSEKVQSLMADNKRTLNDWGALTAEVRKVGKKQREKFTLTVKSDALRVNLDAKTLGAPVADAIAAALATAISSVQSKVAETTAEYRVAAARAFDEGKAWAMRRYPARGPAGLRGAARASAAAFESKGPFRPDSDQQSRKLFDSGHFTRSIVARATKYGEWVVNVSTRRMDSELVRQRVLTILSEEVPLFAQPSLLGRDAGVADAVLASSQRAVQLAGAAARQQLLDALAESAERAQELAQAAEEFGE